LYVLPNVAGATRAGELSVSTSSEPWRRRHRDAAIRAEPSRNHSLMFGAARHVSIEVYRKSSTRSWVAAGHGRRAYTVARGEDLDIV